MSSEENRLAPTLAHMRRMDKAPSQPSLDPPDEPDYTAAIEALAADMRDEIGKDPDYIFEALGELSILEQAQLAGDFGNKDHAAIGLLIYNVIDRYLDKRAEELATEKVMS